MRHNSDSDKQIDDLFSGLPAGEESHAEIARHLAGARSQLLHAPAPEVEERHLTAMLEAARQVEQQPVVAAAPRPEPSGLGLRVRALAFRLSGGVLVASMSTAGLAYAGVDLPGTAAEKAFEVVGVQLPNQGPKDPRGPGSQGSDAPASSVSDSVHEVIEGTEARGCAFGQAVSEVASQNRRSDPKPDVDHCRNAVAPGRNGTAGEAPAKGADNASASQSKRKDAEKREDAATKGGSGKATGETKSADGKAQAQESSNGKAAPADPAKGAPAKDAPPGAPEVPQEASTRGSEQRQSSKAPAVDKLVDDVTQDGGSRAPSRAAKRK